MRLTLITPPDELPVSLDHCKDHCRVASSDDDEVINRLLNAAVGYLDGYQGVLGRCLVTQRWRADVRAIGERIMLPFPDATVEDIVYSDAGAGAVAWRWHESLVMPVITPIGGWSRPASITFRAGYGGAMAVPEPLKLAILMLVVHWYDNRGAADVPAGFDQIISPYRVRRL